MSGVLEQATEHQGRARVALSAALASGPSHAYLFRGPRGAGKRAAARAFAAEILAIGADDPEDVRRRALLDPSPHPDLVWLAPRGAQHLVEEVRERVIRAAAYRPFEGGKRVFVIEAAEAMRDESQNALLKTLEEPPGYVHLILLSSEPEVLLETITSRCQPVDFASLPPAVVEAQLSGAGSPEEVAAAARLSAGDPARAGYLISASGQALREAALRLVGAMGVDSPDARARQRDRRAATRAPWRLLLKIAADAGEETEAATREALEEQAEAGMRRTARDIAEESKRAGRRRRTAILDLGLELCAAWLRDLAAIAAGAEDVAFNCDRLEQLRAQAGSIGAARARRLPKPSRRPAAASSSTSPRSSR